MLVVSVLEVPLGESIIMLDRIIRGGDSGLIHNTTSPTLAVQGTVLGLAAITCGRRGVGAGRQGLGVMGCYDGSHVAHTTVAALDVPAVKQLAVPVIPRKVLVHQLQESLGNIGGNILVEGGIEPDNVSGALSSVGSCRLGG